MRYLDKISVALFVGGAITLTQISLADELKREQVRFARTNELIKLVLVN